MEAQSFPILEHHLASAFFMEPASLCRFTDDRSVVEAQAIKEIDEQLQADKERYVFIQAWNSRFKPWLGPQFCFLLTQPQRYVVNGIASKYNVKKTSAYAAATGDSPGRNSAESDAAWPTPDRIKKLRKNISCRFWEQGNCIHGEGCRYSHSGKVSETPKATNS